MAGVSDSAYLGGAGVGAASSTIMGFINNMWADARTRRDRQENYYFGELAARNADRRTRALYNDFYSPAALLQQYEQAGLSPSMMFGGTPGQGGMSGARGSGASGPTTPFMPISMVEAAQAELLLAQTRKTNAETNNITVDTERSEIARDYEQMLKDRYSVTFKIETSYVINNDGSKTSLYELAGNFNSYEDFVQKAKEMSSDKLKDMLNTEAGQKEMRSIFIARNYFNREISVLSEENVAADFQKSIIQAMQKEGFEDLNAQAAIAYLKANIQTQSLTEEQKESWNDVIKGIEKRWGTTTKDIIVILSTIVNHAMANWNMPSFQTFNKNEEHTQITNTYTKK